MGSRQQKVAKAQIAQRRDRTAADDREPPLQPRAQLVQQGKEIIA
jgi:hypothetical protein